VSRTNGAVVLLVQPRSEGSEIYAELLRDHGLTPLAVSNARDALAVAAKADVIVTGVLLPGSTDGIGLIAQLRSDERTRHTPIIVLTVCTWQTERERCQDAGCDVFLPKPCLPDALLREVQRLLATGEPARPELLHRE
jgi:two-component system cell cycle response regulator DivK